MPAMCMTSGWLLSIAFSLAFGAMFAKTWRVYVIFGNKSGRMRKPLQDKHLLLGVGSLVMVDVAVMATWTVIDPMYLTYHIQTDTLFQETDGKRLITKHESCTSELKTYWIGGLLAEKGLLLIFGCFLAFETRRVFVPELNDSKYLGMCIYNTCVLCGVGASVAMIVSERPAITFAFSSLCIIASAATTLGLLFVPKISYVKKHPNGKQPDGITSTFKASLRNVHKELSNAASVFRSSGQGNEDNLSDRKSASLNTPLAGLPTVRFYSELGGTENDSHSRSQKAKVTGIINQSFSTCDADENGGDHEPTVLPSSGATCSNVENRCFKNHVVVGSCTGLYVPTVNEDSRL
ncbi:gamma-aminobutyric acid type B receptor subunit 2-like isoform X1 [Lingula anatina]|uniref:Gamma-aminobutyric acid type B receptor subunit 2-like isoform X1 n=1 Tax=Lingula anatina TaxID=7574 RepID=A0A1S3IK09_LINAN|nr:gamma-aminobutyric acid type B receptor subunit 2-like isoform X1 [Lingula anatina]|eukprot:XP_013398211.1 gamma-aminobutyric acid type B receptor subunit 2-like isoform X1 [Lingula anatina]